MLFSFFVLFSILIYVDGIINSISQFNCHIDTVQSRFQENWLVSLFLCIHVSEVKYIVLACVSVNKFEQFI